MVYSNKHGRQERRMPASALVFTVAVVLSFLLIALWILAFPQEGSSDSNATEAVATRRRRETDHVGGGVVVSSGWNSEHTDAGWENVDIVDAHGKQQLAGNEEKESFRTEDRSDQQKEMVENNSSSFKSVDDDLFTEQSDNPKESKKKNIMGGDTSSQTQEFNTKPTITAEAVEEQKKQEGSSPSNNNNNNNGSKEFNSESETTTAMTREKKENKIEDGEDEEEEEQQKSLSQGLQEVVMGDSGAAREEEVVAAVKYKWRRCTWRGAQDYIPCLDNKNYLRHNKAHKHFEHRERHCPSEAEQPKCLVPLPLGYKAPILWPQSRDEVWYDNVPYQKLVSFKADQNWMKKIEDKLVFPGGGTQFKDGAGQYINFIQRAYPEIEWGKNIRVLLDVGCGVASFGGYLFDRDVITMSFAPKDEHEAQVQLALERGIPAVSSVMGTQRLVFPSNVFDIVHCARCRVRWHGDGGLLLLELNRILRPGGYFVWSATPVYQNDPTDQQAWNKTLAVTESMSWKLVAKQNSNEAAIGVAIFQKPKDNELYKTQKVTTMLPFCPDADNADAAWYVKMRKCIHRIPNSARSEWPAQWPDRVNATPAWLTDSQIGIYGKLAPEDYRADTEHWEHAVHKSYLQGVGIDWTTIRNIMDMNAGYGGFAAALIKQPVWVMNIVPITEPDTLPIIYDRGLIGMYHDWCEPHSTYPRTYDLLHANHIISSTKNRCNVTSLIMEMDRILRPNGWAIFRDQVEVLSKVEEILRSLHWDVILTYKKDDEELLAAQKTFWRPDVSS